VRIVHQDYGRGFNGIRAKITLMATVVTLVSAAGGFFLFDLTSYDNDGVSVTGAIIATALLVSIACAISLRTTTSISRPILAMLNSAGEIASGSLDVKVKVSGRTEADALGVAFNSMTESLKGNIAHLHTLAYQDAVTGLSNRTVLDEVLAEATHFAGGAVISIDLDRFNEVNQAFGHQVGDALLRQAAHRLVVATVGMDDGEGFDSIARRPFQSFARDRMLFRSAADEFVAVILRPTTDVELNALAKAMVDCLARPFLLSGSEIRIGGSVGVARIGRDACLPEELGRFADLAMEQAKTQGGSRYVFFNDDLRATAARRAQLERDFKFAIQNDELVVHFQPKVSVDDGSLMGVEALVRWAHPSKGLLYPADFLPIAEAKGMMSQIGRKVFELSAKQVREWQKHGLWIRVAVNVNPTQFMNANFADEYIALAKSMGVLPQQFVLEITETVAMSNTDAANGQLAKLKAAGFRIAIDDFGVGYSNLAQLYRLQFDFIKVDRSLIEDIDTDINAQRIIGFTIGMAHEMGKQVVAEGIETEGQRRELVKLGCDYAQGYLFGKPMESADIIERYCTKTNVEYLRVVAA
jgi:predicted signal transduction protein with EAL and GGDEF domain